MSTTYQDAKSVVREHEAANLGRFLAELRTLTERYLSVPGSSELAARVHRAAGLEYEDQQARMHQAMQSLTRA